MAISIRPAGERVFLVPEDRPPVINQETGERGPSPEYQTRFLIRDQTVSERRDMVDRLHVSVDDRSGAMAYGSGTRIYEVCRTCLVGTEEGSPLYVEGDAEGAPPKAVPFEKGADGYVSDAYLDVVGWDRMQAIYNAVMMNQVLAEEDLKKSEPPQQA